MKTRILNNVLGSKLHAFWWSGLVALLIGIPLLAVLELLRRDTSYATHLLRLVIALFVLWIIAIAALVIEYLDQRALISVAETVRDRLRLAMTAGKSAGWDLDVRTGKLLWFGDLKTICGIPSDSFVTDIQSFYRTVHPDDRGIVAAAVDEAKMEHSIYDKEFRIIWPDGTIRWVAAKGEFVYSRSGEPLRMLGSGVDITERKRTEEALRISEEKFSKAFRESPLSLTLTSVRDHRYVDVNDTFERLTGWSRAEVLGRTPFEINLWVNPEERWQLVKRLENGESLRNIKSRFRRRDGTELVCLGSADLIRIGNEDFMVAAVADITEQETMQQQLRESEERFRGVVDSAMDAIIAIDENRQVVLFNPAAETMFLCAKSQALGKSLAQFIPERFRTEHDRHVQHFRDWGVTTRSMSIFRVLYGLRSTGEEFPVEASISQVSVNGKQLLTAIIRDISERRRKDEALVQSEERLRLAVQAGRMYVDQWDSSSDLMIRSADCAQILGVGAALQITRRAFLSHIHPDDRQQYEESFSKLTPQQPTSWISFRQLGPDGSMNWLEQRMRGSFDKTGRLLRTIGVVSDVTERKRAEEALRISEDRFRRVVEHIGDAVIVDDIAGHVVFANDRFLDLFGFKREQLGELKLEDYVAPQFRKELRDRHDRRMRGESVPLHYEYEGNRLDGTSMWLEVEVVPIHDDEGKTVGAQSAIRDITERKRMQRILQESEERFRLVANSAPVMIWMSGTDRLCNYFNQTWLAFTGSRAEQEIGEGWTSNVHPEDLKSCMDVYAHAFERRHSFESQFRLRRFDNEYRWILNNGVPRFDESGTFAGYIGSCIDMTERKLAEEALASMGRRLIEAHEEERSWIARELHDDINQRLALIAIELEKWNQQFPHPAPDFRSHIQQTRKRLFDLSKDIQALSHRLHSSKLEYLGIVAAAKSFCSELAEQHNVQITFDHSDVPRSLDNEIALCLFRVLQESLQNAVKHSQAQQFRVQLYGGSDAVTLEVVDAGVGFDHSQVMLTRGLGLTSMRERLKLVGGDLAIESAVGQGTKVRARIPLHSEVKRMGMVG